MKRTVEGKNTPKLRYTCRYLVWKSRIHERLWQAPMNTVWQARSDQIISQRNFCVSLDRPFKTRWRVMTVSGIDQSIQKPVPDQNSLSPDPRDLPHPSLPCGRSDWYSMCPERNPCKSSPPRKILYFGCCPAGEYSHGPIRPLANLPEK